MENNIQKFKHSNSQMMLTNKYVPKISNLSKINTSTQKDNHSTV